MIKKLIFTAILALNAAANSFSVGDTVPDITINDQFEKAHKIDANVKTVLFASDKDASDILKNTYFQKKVIF